MKAHKIDLLNPATAKSKYEDAMVYDNGLTLFNKAQTKSTITDARIDLLILNYKNYLIEGTLKDHILGLNDDEKELLKYIHLICNDILLLPDSEFKDCRLKMALKGLKDEITMSEQFYKSNTHLIDVAKSLFDQLNVKPGRPSANKLIVFVNRDTNEEEYEFKNRNECIEKTGITKTNLSLYIKSNKSEDKSKWKKFKYNGQWYWIFEE